ncbi:amino acid adenylation domain-containing protein [Pseudoalteromonas sp. MMG013]|uniref:non-ribosomal peptide synthetase n=1 Tax=Pseudoalteromonas sp. MMG013 TaxID=2822687 RepID=UPI001B36B35B|nr:non-ribosomal peptide synthetase [Pseudoalteromonas sp. MMG013]MBQ4862192.1 amino acid adenylation domain-containing protein [Pseudoalteromonas sp. MMG013]
MNLFKMLIDFKERGFIIDAGEDKLSIKVTKGPLLPLDKEALKSEKLNIINLYKFLNINSNAQLAPASFSQQRLWFINQLEGDSSNYNIIDGFSINFAVNTEAFAYAFNKLIERHEILRTCYEESDGDIYQIIKRTCSAKITIHDFTQYERAVSNNKAEAVILKNNDYVFDLKNGPILTVDLCLISSTQSYVVANIHHIASDGWSQNIFRKEIIALYEEYISGDTNTLPTLSLQFSDYAHWERKFLSGDNLSKHLNYWTNKLDGVPPLHSLPLDRPRASVQSFAGCLYDLTIPTQLISRLSKICSDNNASTFMALSGVFSYLLGRLSHENDIVFATPIANREQTETASLIGFFVNTLVLRFDLSDVKNFTDLLKLAKDVCIGAYSHQQMPLDEIIQHLNAPRSLSYSPVFQIMFSTHNIDNPSEKISNNDTQGPKLSITKSKFDLSVSCIIDKENYHFSWCYNSSLFDESTIALMARCYVNLLEQITNNPHKNLSELHLVEDKTSQQPAQTGDDMSLNGHPKVHELLRQQAIMQPEKVAVITPRCEITYEELNKKVNQFVHYLVSLGVKQGDRVVLCLAENEQLVIAIFAILKIGACYVSLNKTTTQARLDLIVEDLQPRLLISDMFAAEQPSGVNCQVMDVREHRLHEVMSRQLECELDMQVGGDNLAYISYTSGSTGKPKGVMVTHDNLLAYLTAASNVYEVNDHDRVLQFSSVSFDIFVEELFCSLCFGGTLVFEDKQAIMNIEQFAKVVRDKQVSILSLPTAFFHVMCAHVSALDSDDFKTLRLLIVGGEKLSAKLSKTWLSFNQEAKLLNTYGPTETTVIASAYNLSNSAPLSNIPIGKPIKGVQCHILDQYGHVCPDGIKGELYILGDTVAKGYWNNQKLTDEAFVTLPFSNRKKAYKTGDIVRRLACGNLEFIGRNDAQVKVRGFRIELGEIEAQLTQLEWIDSALVMTKNLAGESQLIGYVKSHQPLDAQGKLELLDKVKAALTDKLPDYMIPRALIVVEEWPLTANGKVDKRALPDTDETLIAQLYRAPITEQELRLAAIWSDLLKVPVTAISTAASFFELGGHSLLVLALIVRLKAEYGAKITVADVFRYQTLEQMVTFLSGGNNGHAEHYQAVIPYKNDEGNRVLVLIHGVDGDALPLMDIAAHSMYWDKVFIIQNLGMVHESVAQQSQYYANALLEHFDVTSAQLLVCGWSMGGCIAYLVKEQLEHMSTGPVLLSMLDSYLPQQVSAQVSWQALLLQFAQSMGVVIEQAQLQDAAQLSEEQALGALFTLAKRAQDDWSIGESDWLMRWKSFKGNSENFSQCQLQAGVEKALLITANNHAHVSSADGWQSYINILSIKQLESADHYTMVGAEHAKLITVYLQEYMLENF